MRPANSKSRWFAVMVCVLATIGGTSAEEGVVRVSDADSRPGVVKMGAGEAMPKVKRTSLAPPNARGYYRSSAYSPHQHFAAYAQYYGIEPKSDMPAANSSYQQVSFSTNGGSMAELQPAGFATSMLAMPPTAGGCGCGNACGCSNGSCGTEGCNSFGRCGSGRRLSRKERRISAGGWTECPGYGNGYRQRLRLLAGAVPKTGCNDPCYAKRWWRGQTLNFQRRNQRLANCLFGWMVPSGCNGQGCPPVGCYQITYADDPGYADSRDGQQYGVQGYGVPLTVPLAPNVRYSYNYSWGTPSSRLTQVGQYDPQTSPQPLYRRSF